MDAPQRLLRSSLWRRTRHSRLFTFTECLQIRGCERQCAAVVRMYAGRSIEGVIRDVLSSSFISLLASDSLRDKELGPDSYILCPAAKQEHGRHRSRIVQLYDQLRPPLFTYLISLKLNACEAEDIILESFLRLVQHLSKEYPDRNLRGWLFRVAHNLAIELFRDGRNSLKASEDGLNLTETEQADPSLNPEQRLIETQEFHRIQKAFERLTSQSVLTPQQW